MSDIYESVLRDLRWRRQCKLNPKLVDVGERYKAILSDLGEDTHGLPENPFPTGLNAGELLPVEQYDSIIKSYEIMTRV